jgi:hypothetical protein
VSERLGMNRAPREGVYVAMGSVRIAVRAMGPPSYDVPTKLYSHDQRSPCGRKREV